jgi:hypothetical protein
MGATSRGGTEVRSLRRLWVWLVVCSILGAALAGPQTASTRADVAADEYDLSLPVGDHSQHPAIDRTSDDGVPRLWIGLLGAAALGVAAAGVWRLRPRGGAGNETTRRSSSSEAGVPGAEPGRLSARLRPRKRGPR